MKKTIVFVIIILMVINPTVSYAEETTLADLGQEYMENTVIALLIAAGLSFSSRPEAVMVSKEYMLATGTVAVGGIVVTEGIATITETAWDSIKTWVSGNFQDGENNIALDYYSYMGDAVSYQIVNGDILQLLRGITVVGVEGSYGGAIYRDFMWVNNQGYLKLSFTMDLTDPNVGGGIYYNRMLNTTLPYDQAVIDQGNPNYTVQANTIYSTPSYTWINPYTNGMTIDISVDYGTQTQDEIINQNVPTVDPPPITDPVIIIPDVPLPPAPEDDGSWWYDSIMAIYNMIKGLMEFLGDLIGSFLTALKDLIVSLLVPSDDYFQGFWDEIKQQFDGKFTMAGQISDFMSQVDDVTYTEDVPSFEITIEKYGIANMSIIDFVYFAQYRAYIFNFIRFIAWFLFLKKLLKKLPQIVY